MSVLPSRRATPAMRVAAVSAAALLFGCGDPTYPGDSVGTFAVVGAITSNTCGTNLQLVDPLAFDVELRDDDGVAYWRRPRTSLFTGVWFGSQFTFGTQDEVRVIEPDAANGVAGCILTQSVVVQGTVESSLDGGIFADAGDDAGVVSTATAFSGTQAIMYAQQTGSDCTAVVPPLGSTFAVLPCTVVYSLGGTRTTDL